MMNKQLISLQLFSVRDYTAKDFRGTLRKVAAMGYQGVEFAGYGDMTAQEMKAFLAECGLKPIGSHVPYKMLLEKMPEVIEYQQVIGNPYVVCPGAPMHTRDDYTAMAETFNRFGEACKQAGLLFGYHNHSHEFQAFDSPTQTGKKDIGYDLLLAGAQKDLVFFEMDTCWVSAAGFDPKAYCANYPGRFRLAHIKDYLDQRDEKGRVTQTDVGKGAMDFPALIPALEANGTEYMIIEQEGGVGESIDYVARSLENLKGLLK